MYIKTKLGFNNQLGKIKVFGIFFPRLYFNQKWNSGERNVFFYLLLSKYFQAKKIMMNCPNVGNYVYGALNGRVARKHINNGNVQFVLWKKGDQEYVDGIGHTEDKWVNFDSSWWIDFKP
jgi:hypothetical protein